ncbi:F-box and WD repeat domain containing protein 10B-like [Lineus longissimus]|uniref:F-box and WD repeat domain containing protein 10B-like n=1 Tax=Lineus longissimus TaxID=88925 RepID=UPI00315D6759
MIEVCQINQAQTAEMKHPSRNCEPFEFNIGKAFELRCVESDKALTCGDCESCRLVKKLNQAKQWFPRLGTQSQRRFTLGLVRRFHSVDLLEYIWSILRPLTNKDFTYSRSRTQPSVDGDQPTVSGDRALNLAELENELSQMFDWFRQANYWTKCNFMMGIMQDCDQHLLYSIAQQAKTLLISEKKASISFANYTEAGSIDTTHYSYDTEDHPEHDMLRSASVGYSTIKTDPFSDNYQDVEDEIINDDSGSESFGEDIDDGLSNVSSIDPACMVVPTSAKAFVGVTKRKDIIRALPVHISKYVLSYLDQVSLTNCLCVSKYWRVLAEEVTKEYYVNQQLWEDVMIMQGAAAQSANPNFAKDIDVLVPNVHIGSYDVIHTDDAVIDTTFKSEVSFETAYSGVSTKKVIMEERNVYCGAYNVMVVLNEEDAHRVMHTDGGQLIATGSAGRKVHLLDADTGKQVGPTITGHAGSVKAVHLSERRGFVLSGGYDTSIRCWDIKTGKCLKIFRGHQGTVQCLSLYKDLVVSGAKDNNCKVWDLKTGKCIRTFKHRHPVTAVALGAEICVSGSDDGKVKVWDMKNGQLIKVLGGHNGQVTAVKFDRWHIVTGSKDGYALIWSAKGNHNRCLTALRHQKEVLCLEFMHLRVITGSADGRIRIWNIINGQCCRIMRGNSRSDPVWSLTAIENRITVNTQVNLLVLNFEEVELDYTLESDKMPPLVHYGSYSDAPVRKQPYPYIRAQRMKKAGATNTKIVRHDREDDPPPGSPLPHRSNQMPHSAKSLRSQNLEAARMIQSRAGTAPERMRPETAQTQKGDEEKALSAVGSKAPTKPTRSHRSSKPPTAKTHVSISQAPTLFGDDSSAATPFPDMKRRISWAFEEPLVPKSKALSLSETKAVLRSQIRQRDTAVPPDFIYLAVNAIQNTLKPNATNVNTTINIREEIHGTNRNRPNSSPPKFDPRVKIPVEEMNLDDLKSESGIMSDNATTIASKSSSFRSRGPPGLPKAPRVPVVENYTTGFMVSSVSPVSGYKSVHPRTVKSSIPKGRIVRPHTASVCTRTRDVDGNIDRKPRPHTAVLPHRGVRAVSSCTEQSSASAPVMRRKDYHGNQTTATELSFVPMLMYPPDMMEKIRARAKTKIQLVNRSRSEPALGKTSACNDPMRTHAEFKLRTFNQEKEYLASIQDLYAKQHLEREVNEEKLKRKNWLKKAKGRKPVLSVK